MSETAAEVTTPYPPLGDIKLKHRETPENLMKRSDVSGGDLASLAERKLGWKWDHDTGSHMIYKRKTADGKEITISIPNHKPLKRGTKGVLIKLLFPPQEN